MTGVRRTLEIEGLLWFPQLTRKLLSVSQVSQ